MPRIQVLPPGLVNQIAAGEVVERPASVVKELVENALDAGARSIQVEIADGGLSLVRVADDGSGMDRGDALLSLERHATSKLVDAAGLSAIATMGFRGEALAAIASVSRLRLDTCPDGASAAGTRIVLDGGRMVEQSDVARARGTTVEVRDLFFNTPARRKFMRAPAAEAGHASEAIVRLVLSRADVGFSLRSAGRMVLSTSAGADPRERAVEALGREAHPHLLDVDAERGEIRVRGLVCAPDHSEATGRSVYLFVNGRYVRDRGAAHAVLRAYAGTLPAGRHPAAVLFLDLPLDRVDVNVHPQKLEVRFADGRRVYEALYHAVSATLRGAPWLRHASAAPDATSPPVPLAREDAAMLLAEARAAHPAELATTDVARTPPDRLRPSLPLAESATAGTGYFSSLRYIGQHARTYLLCEAPNGSLVVVDQHASHERLLFERLRGAFRADRIPVQPYLVPHVVTLPAAPARALESALGELLRLGLELEPFGGGSFSVKGAPAALAGTDLGRLLADLAQQLEEAERGSAVDAAHEALLATMACHAAIRAHEAISAEEARALLDALDGIEFKARCPHGRPVVFEMTLGDLERRVGRT